jgi:ABC-type lipoprotein export system ATPase subunit
MFSDMLKLNKHQIHGPQMKLHELRKTYRSDDNEIVALNDITLDINAGEFVSIMGP